MRLSNKGLQILGLFLSDIRQERSGADISKVLNIGSGTLYPLLARFEAYGWLTSKWETDEPSKLGRPRRRNYQLTGEGVNIAGVELSKIPALTFNYWLPERKNGRNESV